MSPACDRELSSLLPAYALDAVSDEERDLVRHHLSECLACALALVELREAALAIDAAQPEPGPGVWPRILEQIRLRGPAPAGDHAPAAPPDKVRRPVITRQRTPASTATATDVDLLRLTSAAAHDLLWIETAAEATAILVGFVRALGADIVPITNADADYIPIDLSFGEGEPVFATSPRLSVTRLLLEESLPLILEDARRAIGLARERKRRGS